MFRSDLLFVFRSMFIHPERVSQLTRVGSYERRVRSTFEKILLLKIVESFAKDSGLCSASVIEMIQPCLPESVRKSVQKWKVTACLHGSIAIYGELHSIRSIDFIR